MAKTIITCIIQIATLKLDHAAEDHAAKVIQWISRRGTGDASMCNCLRPSNPGHTYVRTSWAKLFLHVETWSCPAFQQHI